MAAAVIIISWVLSAGVAAFIASTKNRSAGNFALAGLLLGPIGVVWAALANPNMPRAEQRREDEIRQAYANADRAKRRKLQDTPRMRWPEG